jgi:hypothetical protein
VAAPVIEPALEVPAEFKQLIRRARKQLERSADPRLLAAYNAFTSALNAARSREELEALGDDLADAHDDVRQKTP